MVSMGMLGCCVSDHEWVMGSISHQGDIEIKRTQPKLGTRKIDPVKVKAADMILTRNPTPRENWSIKMWLLAPNPSEA